MVQRNTRQPSQSTPGGLRRQNEAATTTSYGGDPQGNSRNYPANVLSARDIANASLEAVVVGEQYLVFSLLGRELALAQQLHAVAHPAHEAGLEQDVGVDGGLGVELAGGDRLLDPPQVDLGEHLAVQAVEAALRHAHVQRHLAAFKAMHLVAGTGLGALDAAPRRLAQA